MIRIIEVPIAGVPTTVYYCDETGMEFFTKEAAAAHAQDSLDYLA